MPVEDQSRLLQVSKQFFDLPEKDKQAIGLEKGGEIDR